MDRETLERFRTGDETAFKAVYQRYGGAVYTVAMSILGDPGLAADATQITFVKAWRAASTYDPDRELAPWIYAIARRTAIDIYRKQKPSAALSEADDPAYGPGLEDVWEAFEVRLALDSISDDEREVIRLSHFEGLSHAEIAERLGIPLGTVKSRSHRAHRHLLELLEHLLET
ncbi:MAG TPA: sigma-70 family RNA polymerase sigma factor [Acidimicrobiia bacterium]